MESGITGHPWNGWPGGAPPYYNPNTFTTGNITFSPPGIPTPPAPVYQFNIIILADGTSVRGLDQNDIATKIGNAIAAAFQAKDDQDTLEDLAE